MELTLAACPEPLLPGRQSCDFDAVESLTARRFVTEYLLPGRPVLLRGVASQSPLRAALARARVAETCVLRASDGACAARLTRGWVRDQALGCVA